MNLLLAIAGLGIGAVIGYGFGTLQRHALSRNERRQTGGKLKNGWTIMPGAGGRVAMFLIVLLLVQLLCPLLFENQNIPWLMTAGILLAYAWTLVQKLRQRSTLPA
jgi:hypothetical protein